MPKIIKSIALLIIFCISILPAFADSEDDFSPGDAPSTIFFALIIAGIGWLIAQVKFIRGLGMILMGIGLLGAAATILLFILHYVAIVVSGLLRIAFYIAIVIGSIWLIVQAYNWLTGKSKNES